MTPQDLLTACKTGIDTWQKAFNSQDATGCANQYTPNSVMNALPFGEFKGRDAIQKFWQNIIDQGYKDVDYTNVQWEPLGEDGYILTSSWTMNKAFGVVHREHWQVQEDGVARLVTDKFEIQGEL